jgi:hypothetical protein
MDLYSDEFGTGQLNRFEQHSGLLRNRFRQVLLYLLVIFYYTYVHSEMSGAKTIWPWKGISVWSRREQQLFAMMT